MNNNSILWWSYDPESKSFGSLPAGPLLLPALGIIAFVSIAKALRDRATKPEAILGSHVFNGEGYKRKKARHDYLVQKKINDAIGTGPEFTIADQHELSELQRSGTGGSACPF